MQKVQLVENKAVCICGWETVNYDYTADRIHDWSLHYQLNCPEKVLYCDGRVNNVPANRR